MNGATTPDWNPRSQTVLGDPLAAYDAMREKQPVAYSDLLGWSVFRYADVLRVLHDPETFSSQVSRHISVPSGMDPPQHSPYRRLIDPYFSETRIAAFAPACRTIATEIVASALGRERVEWMKLARTFAVRSQCAFLNWPPAMQEMLLTWISENQAAVFAEDKERLAQLARQLTESVRTMLHNRSTAGDDITSELARAQVYGRSLHERELVSILRNWTAGEVGTLSAAAGILVRFLAADPELQNQLRGEPSRLAYAIEEILRIEGPLVSNRRVTTQPVELHGRRIGGGQRITIIWPAANRDSHVFEAPTRFRWNRDQSMNLLWGAGIHACPGAALARLELRVLMEQLLAVTARIEPGVDSPTPATYPSGGYSVVPVSIVWR